MPAGYEFVTLLARIANSINSHPLGISRQSSTSQGEDFLQPITPNQMLLGRSNPENPLRDFTESDKFTERIAYVQNVEKIWWQNWIKECLPTLLPARKWKIKSKNLNVGDVVLLSSPTAHKSEYILAKVTEVFPDKKNLIRTVKIKYRRKNSREAADKCNSKMNEELVSVQRLILIEPAFKDGSEH